ncbi:MAG TPA: hypothetical protein VFC07_13505 [Verrucomicrobiae bacterium]|nr:hypothetical protein [Verrucomicrobiae bacterium]
MRNYLLLVMMIGAGLFAICGPVQTSGALPNGAGDLVARIHFSGSTQVAGDPNAAALKEIMALPATAPMMEETMQKLATTPYRLFQKRLASRTNDYAGVIRPILDDLLHFESYAEMRGPTNHVPELLLAVRLDQGRAEYWRTNLATILTAWTGIPVTKIQAEGFQGWDLKKHHNPNRIRFIRAGDWALFGWGQDDLLLQPGMLQRIKSKGRPAPPLKDIWLDAWVDWPAITPYHPLPLPFKMPKMQLTLEGKKDFIRPKITMQFPQPLGMSLDPWRIPTNTIRNNLVSFTAARGIGPWLDQLPSVRSSKINPLPNEWFTWAVSKNPFEMCLAAPVTGGTNLLKRIGPGVVSLINSNFASHRINGQAVLTPNGEIAVKNFLFFRPYLRVVSEPSGEFLMGGMFPSQPRKEPLPPGLVQEIMNKPKLVYYDWEITQDRLGDWRLLSQLSAMLSGLPLPNANTPVQKWLIAVAPKMSACGTEVTLTAPNELTLVRNAPLGFSASELIGLGYWIDAPGFPMSAHHEKAVLNPRAAMTPVKAPPAKTPPAH